MIARMQHAVWYSTEFIPGGTAQGQNPYTGYPFKASCLRLISIGVSQSHRNVYNQV